MSIVRFDPLFRTVRDFDRISGELLGSRAGYEPAYDIVEHGEDRFAVALAVPGFDLDELEITAKDRELVIKGGAPGRGPVRRQGRGPRHLCPAWHRAGCVPAQLHARRAHRDRRRSLDKGILRVELERRVPEAMKPRNIQIAAPRGAATAGEQAA
jgi:molecular chaperone IbpA